jgi:predicted nucleic-acid-binding protein
MLEQAKPGSLLLDRVIIEELGYVLHSNYGFDKQRVADVYRSLLREAVFYITDRELTAAAVKLFVSERPLSFEDCWLLALKRAGRVGDVLTFDAALQKRVSRS